MQANSRHPSRRLAASFALALLLNAACSQPAQQQAQGPGTGQDPAGDASLVAVAPLCGTDGQQLNKTLLLSDKAEIDSKPELEIHADDVKCSHGATVGQLDEDSLFFLRSRGIPEARARALLTAAFATDVVGTLAEGPVRLAVQDIVDGWMS